MKVIFDCDNTMGVPGCDISDGLALLYLLGKKNVDVCGITTTYGNGNLDSVYKNTVAMLAEVNRMEIPVLRGCANRYSLESEAADYLVEMVNACPGELSILATGTLTNLYAAYVKDHDFFNKISQLVVMGGMTHELIVNGKVFEEWNFSSDPSATLWVFKEGKNLSVITRNMGLNAFVQNSHFMHRLSTNITPIGRFMMDRSISWLEYNRVHLKSEGFYAWDLLAAAYLANSQLFEDQHQIISLNHKKVGKGILTRLNEAEDGCKVNLPVILNMDALQDDFYNSWLELEYDLK